jgi:hypothetical protein
VQHLAALFYDQPASPASHRSGCSYRVVHFRHMSNRTFTTAAAAMVFIIIAAALANSLLQENALTAGNNLPATSIPSVSSTPSHPFATPSSGPAPLTVTTASFDGCAQQQLDWGDQTPEWSSGFAMDSCGGGIPAAQHPRVSLKHTYTFSGSYTITSSGIPIATITVINR